MSRRILLNILLLVSILFFPWWVSLLVAASLLIFYPAFEVLFWGVYFDAFYGSSIPVLFGLQYGATLLMFVLILLSFVVKRKIIFYQI